MPKRIRLEIDWNELEDELRDAGMEKVEVLTLLSEHKYLIDNREDLAEDPRYWNSLEKIEKRYWVFLNKDRRR